MQSEYSKYLREELLPSPFCVGCGGGTVLNAFVRACDNLKIENKDILIVSGIGCSSWIPSPFFKSDVLHTTHGRAIAFATGSKIVNPNLKVVVFTGDGDGLAIGGNHLIHGARNNIDITVLCINNFIYGMTGGQSAPTTPFNAITSTTPYGNPSFTFDACELVKSAGASYVARWTTYHVKQLIRSIEKGLTKKGFSFIEIISQCPTYFGRKNEMKTPSEMVNWFKENSGKDKKIVIGEFVDIEKKELSEEIWKLIAKNKVSK